MSSNDDSLLKMLVVEDSTMDVIFLKEAIKESQMPVVVSVVSDGDSAMRFLKRQPPFADAPRPDVMVLDLNLPVKKGKEVLAEMAYPF